MKVANLSAAAFTTPESYAQQQVKRMIPARGQLVIASCRSGAGLASKVVEQYNNLLAKNNSASRVQYLPSVDFEFSDTETNCRLDQHISGCDAFIIQCLRDPTSNRTVDTNYGILTSVISNFRDLGAEHITVVVPYLAYGRQEKPTKWKREPTTAARWAHYTIEAGADRIVTFHAHSDALKGFYWKIPRNFLEPIPLAFHEFREFANREDVIVVGPDAGSYPVASNLAITLNVSCGVGLKERIDSDHVIIREILGDFRGKKIAIVIDDVISSAGTLYELVVKLVREKGIKEVYIFASANQCDEKAKKRLKDLHDKYKLVKMIVTNAIPQTESFLDVLPFIKVRCLSGILARVIGRIHYNQSVSELFIVA
jgi:ribose-phosphate pyrophosphokinase